MSKAAPGQEDQNVKRVEEAPTPDPLLQMFLEFTSDVQRRLLSEMQSAMKAHEPKFQAVYSELRDSVHRELQQKLDEEVDIRLRQEMQEQMQLRDKLATELSNKEAEYESMNRETTEMIENPDVEIAKIVRRTARQRELKAYIRGLKYQQGDEEESRTETTT